MPEPRTDLTGKQRRYLRKLAHHLPAFVQIGHGGLSAGLLKELDQALETHELVKIRFAREAPLEPDEAVPQIEQAISGHVAQVMGRTVVVYRRRSEKPTIELPR